jgi:hypothetical protein
MVSPGLNVYIIHVWVLKTEALDPDYAAEDNRSAIE